MYNQNKSKEKNAFKCFVKLHVYLSLGHWTLIDVGAGWHGVLRVLRMQQRIMINVLVGMVVDKTV